MKDGKRHIRYVHRLVAQAFIRYKKYLPEVDHINGCRWDNRVTNLHWVTHGENMKLAVERRNNMEGK